MANYLVIENDKIVNVIVADSLEIAQEVTGKEVLESRDSTPWLDWTRSGSEWIAPVIEEELPPTI